MEPDGHFGLSWCHEPKPLKLKLTVTHEGYQTYEESFIGNQEFVRNVELKPAKAVGAK
jgi:hypothetical protein